MHHAQVLTRPVQGAGWVIFWCADWVQWYQSWCFAKRDTCSYIYLFLNRARKDTAAVNENREQKWLRGKTREVKVKKYLPLCPPLCRERMTTPTKGSQTFELSILTSSPALDPAWENPLDPLQRECMQCGSLPLIDFILHTLCYKTLRDSQRSPVLEASDPW